jgi:hypothetical protein
MAQKQAPKQDPNPPYHKTTMNNMTSNYFHNDVKFTGSAFESPDNAMTMLMYFAVWAMLAMNAWPN